MHNYDTNRVEFYSKEDLAGPFQLSKGENILRNIMKCHLQFFINFKINSFRIFI